MTLKIKNSQPKTVFAGLSGGVDSSVAALRLKRQGFNVVGVFIKVWQPDFLKCNWEEERLDAMRVAAKLDIPFLTCDAEAAYKKEVGEYFVNEYIAGRTPNPDVLCNKHVKFGAFLDFAKEHGADFVATGHYARKVETRDKGQGTSNCSLLRGVDANKDQSYFLWTLTQGQLEHALFPVGDSTKEEIRKEAEEAGLPTAKKKDSQGICFLGAIDIPEFMSHFVNLKEGAVLDESGKRIGTHRGALVYTLGQRHGFTIDTKTPSGTAHYVVAKDIKRNTVTVGTAAPRVAPTEGVKLVDVNWINQPAKEAALEAQFRYRQKPFRVDIANLDDRTCAVIPKESVERPAVGQSCVIYSGEECLGGGVVS